MILVDQALAERQKAGRPIRVGMIGAGFMGRGVALQIATAVPGMRLCAIANRSLDNARRAYEEAGQGTPKQVESPHALATAIDADRPAVTQDWRLLTEAPELDAILEVTGAIEDALPAVESAIAHGKHTILMNAELDGTVGPILKRQADRAGVIYTNVDGDQPGVEMNLIRFVKGIGVTPILSGNIKGLQDPYRTPETQADFARKWGQKPHMVTSFADGTKISFEQAIVANATGFRVGRRGMYGPTVEPGTPIQMAAQTLPTEAILESGGLVDYVVGAEPGPGIFVLGTINHPVQQHYLALYKLGDGPLYCFHTPCHLCHFEVPNTIARAVLFGDAAIAPAGPPMVDVVATAKTDMKAGSVLDDLGHFMTYGQCENADTVARDGLLPMGLAPGCRLRRDISRDSVLRYADVEIPAGRAVDRLRQKQDRLFDLLPTAAPLTG